ncbi:Fc receptor-like protein 1 isoform 2-T2 [Hipposideros larvatus]
MLLRLLTLLCAPLCEPTALLLKVSPPRPVDGNPMTLTCESQFARQEPHLQFRFMRHSQVLGQDWNNSSQLQVAAVWSGDTGFYWCEALTSARRMIRSKGIWIHVQRVPVGNVRLETQPPGGHVAEGEKLVLVCSVTQATGDISFLWYRGALGLNLETKTQRSLMAKLEIPAVRESDADQYYCAADNGHGPSISTLVNIVVTIPVSRPGLTLSTPGAQALVGDTVELHCEAQRGSPPILYRFYCNDVTLGNSSAPSGGGVSFNLSLTAEHSGNYSCEADNGLRAQRSELVPLRVTAPIEDKIDLTSVVTEGLFGILGLIIMVLFFGCWLKRKIVKGLPKGPPGRPLGTRWPLVTRSIPTPGLWENVGKEEAALTWVSFDLQDGLQPATQSGALPCLHLGSPHTSTRPPRSSGSPYMKTSMSYVEMKFILWRIACNRNGSRPQNL